jgi:hypothetical protein
MNPKRAFALFVLTLFVLPATAVLPAQAKPQAAASDTTSDTTRNPKKRDVKSLKEPAATATSTTAATAPASPSQTAEAKSSTPSSPDAPKKIKTASENSDSEIAGARASGKVWVNLDSGIYHKNGRWYGKTKNGKFMTEAEAKAAGYKQSQRN